MHSFIPEPLAKLNLKKVDTDLHTESGIPLNYVVKKFNMHDDINEFKIKL